MAHANIYEYVTNKEIISASFNSARRVPQQINQQVKLKK